MVKPSRSKPKGPTQRQLRVGEELRHALATVFVRNDLNDPALDRLRVTVSEVRVTPDLRHATAYVAPLGGQNGEQALALLEKLSAPIRHEVTRRVTLRFSPHLRFKLDTSFDYAAHIGELLNQPRVKADITAPEKPCA